jgi:hypothetical protein
MDIVEEAFKKSDLPSNPEPLSAEEILISIRNRIYDSRNY